MSRPRRHEVQPLELAPDTVEVRVELEHGGHTRTCLVHLPAAARRQERVPLVLAFHGGMGRGVVVARQSKMTEVAEREGFAVAYPDGTGRFPHTLTWNAGLCCGYAVEHDIDDVGFVARLIDLLVREHGVDEKRVYATGMSNGGMLCYRLALEIPDRIAAIGAVAATMNVEPREGTRAVAVMHFHGLLDENVVFLGGAGSRQVSPREDRPVPEALAYWARVNGCEPTPEVTEEGEAVIEHYRPAPGHEGRPIVLYKLTEGGHTWPGGEDVTEHWNTGKLVESVHASELMWDFFRSQSLP